MNRWWGSSNDSAKQASERDRRAAKRFINTLPDLSDSEEENFNDCETSINNKSIYQLDGDADSESDTNSNADMVDAAAAAAAELARQRALPVSQSDFQDDPEAWKKEIKLKFDQTDVQYWFNSVESLMKKYGINQQWSKKDAIVALLPDDVVEELKPILRLSQEDAGPTIYKDLKEEIFSLYGPRDEDVFQQCMAMRLSGKPSALGKRLIHKICPGPKPFDNCHCAKMVYGFWTAQLGVSIKSKLAGKKFNKDTYQELFKEADEEWLVQGGNNPQPPAVVAATSVAPQQSPSSSDSQSGQVAALQRGGRGGRGRFNRGGRGNRGGGSGRGGNQNSSYNNNTNNTNNSSSTSQRPHQKGPRASPDVPDNACSRHWKEGRNATYCSDPLNCDWVKIIAPRPNNKN